MTHERTRASVLLVAIAVFARFLLRFSLTASHVSGRNLLKMKVQQLSYDPSRGWATRAGDLAGQPAQLILVFGGRHLLEREQGLDDLRQRYPDARLVIASTSGEMVGTEVMEDTIAATAIHFEKTRVRTAATRESE